MKVFKNKKQRFVAVILSLVFAFMLVPFTDAYAGTVEHISADTGGNISFKNNSSPVYMFHIFDSNGIERWRMASLTSFTYTTYLGNTYDVTDSINCDDIHGNFHPHAFYYEDCIGEECFGETICTYYTIRVGNNDVSYNTLIYEFLENGRDTNFECSVTEGGIDNPIYDEDIGTLIISKSKMYEESNGEDVNDLYNLFSWKMKTNTGFSLSDNKYARTFIQVRVESKCVVYDDRRHTKINKNFDNYGEKAMLINSHPADSQPLKISYLTDIPNVLPKTHAETHNPVYTGYNYTLYFRVVCTDDLAVIPSDTSEWHCGGWRALDCNADILVGQSDTTENGSFDDEDNWVTDEDDGNNSIESGSDSVHDTDEAKDDFNNSSSAVDSSVNGAISTMQSLLDMIRHVPQIISTIFSFLPNWCLNIVGLAFVALVVLIIYKLVRG